MRWGELATALLTAANVIAFASPNGLKESDCLPFCFVDREMTVPFDDVTNMSLRCQDLDLIRRLMTSRVVVYGRYRFYFNAPDVSQAVVTRG